MLRASRFYAHPCVFLICLIAISLPFGCSGGGSSPSSSSSGSTSTPTPTVSAVTIQISPSGTTSLPLQGTLGLAATVTGTGNPATTVTWSVNGTGNGSAAVGTIASAGSGVTYTAPAAPPQPANITITATSTADTSKSASLSLTILVPSVTSVASTTSLPLTPLSIATTGVNPALLLTVQFTDGAGFNFSESPMRIAADGTVVAAVPLYVSNGSITSGNVSVSLVQSNLSTAPISLSIQDLPSVSSYGVQPGQISHAMLVFQAIQMTRRLNAYQAFQVAPGNTVDTTQAQLSLTTLLTSTIEARSDVDRVSLDNTVTIDAGTLPDGTSLQFNAATLDMMDRVQAIFLSQTFGQIALAASNTPGPVPSVHARGHRTFLAKNAAIGHHKPATTNAASGANVGGSMAQILLAMQSLTASGQIPLSTIDFANAQNLSDQVTAVAQGIAPIGSLANETFGAVAALVGVAGTTLHCLEDDGMYAYAEATGDTQTANLIVQDMQNIPADEMYGALETLITSPFLVEEKTSITVASTVFDLVTEGLNYYGIATGDTSTLSPSQDSDLVSVAIATSDGAVFAPPNSGMVEVQGNVDVQTTLGIEAPQSGLDLSPGPGGESLTTIADPDGDYSMWVPLGVSGFDYSTADFSVYDPVADTLLATETVDLSTVSMGQTVQIPSMSGTCNDTDAGAPDGDDPDCD